MGNEIFDSFTQKPTTFAPMIYAYSDIAYPGCLKVGYTSVDIDKRVAQQYPTKRPDGKVPYEIVLRESAMYSDGTSFSDHDVHKVLTKMGVKRFKDTEWFQCTINDVKAAIIAVRTGTKNFEKRTEDFKMRPEQEEAVDKTIAYFKSAYQEGATHFPKFLWNAKMRFGKTFASYELAKKMGFKRILVLTFKPAVESAWKDDLLSHKDFEGWQFIARDPDDLSDSLDAQYDRADKNRPIVCFGSFQDFLGIDKNTGGIKAHNEWVHTINWDIVIFDEYHFGAWRDSAKKLFEQDEDTSYDEEQEEVSEAGNDLDETWLPITSSYYLYLSGTPFRAINSGEFIEEQIYNWTYSDEQKAKAAWVGEDNPYAALPRMVMLTYKIPDSIERIAKGGEYNEFDLNVFFSAEGKGKDAHFKFEDYVQKWLNLIRGSYLETSVDELKLGAEKPPMPYSDTRLLSVLSHTLWFMPNVAACQAMANLLAQKQNSFYHDYTINVCAGPEAGIGVDALKPVQDSMQDPLNSKTITLTCGKLTTGVTIRPWTGIFMLRNLSTPETYFQAAFRVQSPWTIKGDDGKQEIIKKDCYVFDFALNRALRQISDYSCRLNVNESNPEKKVGEFINFLPVLAYDGSAMRQVNAAEILDMAMSGTSATLLAKRWQSALLVNVDNDTLRRLLANPEAMDALMRIEGFRALNKDIETIINKSEAVKKAKKDGKDLTPKQKKELTEEEKQFKSKRKEIQEKLIKFATRIPVFMYLTDFREYSLKDVITQLEPNLFHKVTGLSVKDFELLVSLNVFNEALMNDAVYKFKRYEDASITYTGVNKHEGEKIGLYSTVITKEEYDRMAGELLDSQKLSRRKDDIPDKSYFGDIVGVGGGEDDEDDGDDEEPVIKRGEPSTEPRKEIVQPQSEISKPSQQPSFVPARPSYTPPATPIDVSDIRPGSIVWHKAFGQGSVITIEPEKGTILVKFEGKNRLFQFPGSFLQGFLSKEKYGNQ
jgi:hypothetical protein